MASHQSHSSSERIPFYRNVKMIGIIAQIIFAILVLVAIIIIYLNVSSALSRSNLPADFSFLDDRAGIPIAETPIRYTTNDPYWKALFIGFLNTLKVALIGVVLASLLGIVVGVMRLSTNWLLRQIANVYIELIRNTPLAVQIIFWFTAVLTTVPPNITNPIVLPGRIYLSNRGLALPWLYTGTSFRAWIPWLIVAVIALIIIAYIRQRQIIKSDRPGNPWTYALLSAVLIAGTGFFVASSNTRLAENTTSDFRADRGRGSVYIDANQNNQLDNNEKIVPYALTIVTVEDGTLTTTSQNLTESRRVVNGTFRFPLIEKSEIDVENTTVEFVDPDQAEGLAIHHTNFPSIGLIYKDQNGDGTYNRGEEINPETGRGYSGIQLIMTVKNFERRIVADRDGQIRIPRFDPIQQATTSSSAPAANPNNLFGSPTNSSSDAEEAELEASIALLPSRPLVLSTPSLPISNYEGGVRLTTSYLALLLALVVYTASFIAEIVRGGIQAVSKGQTEAAKALGLSGYQTFTLIVFPQALRIILPPMISQYLNLTKNSSLGPLAGYGELFAISVIVANQTGASVPVIVMLIVAYLLISLTFAFVLNIVNDRMAIVGR